MNATVADLRTTIIPKSDQLNAEQLLAGPLVITVTDVRVGGGEEQPVSVYHDTDPARPFKPCKTMRKVLILAWGADGRQWIGRSMELYCDPSVKFGGEAVGGIRISRMTDIPKDIRVSLTATKGRKALHEIGRLELSNALQDVLAAIAAATGKSGLDRAKAMAKDLRSPADAELALAAYKKRVEALKEQAAAKNEASVDRSTSQVEPADRPDTGTGQQEQPGREHAGDHPTYAQLADRINKAARRDDAELVLDAARHLPADQQQELARLVDAKFPGEAESTKQERSPA